MSESDGQKDGIEYEDCVLSDVHIFTDFTPIKDGKHALSRFYFTSRMYVSDATDDLTDDGPTDSRFEIDKDGDIVVRRLSEKDKTEQNVITIEHTLATPLSRVGTQIWRGALLLCDFVVHSEKMFDGCFALELGAGAGLCSMVLARVAKRVFCTDIADVLGICEINRLRNSELFKYLSSDNDIVIVRELNFYHSSTILDTLFSEEQDAGNTYCGWKTEDMKDLSKVTVVLASDVIYENRLTDAFLDCIMKIFLHIPNVVAYVSLEKRINFSLQDLEVVSPAYDFFVKRLREIEKVSSSPKLEIEKLKTDFPVYFKYDRVEQLELWKIRAVKQKRDLFSER